MKTLVLTLSAVAAVVAQAAPSISIDSVTQDATRAVTVGYTLSGEPAVVTLDAVSTNGAAMASSDLLVVSGGANRLMQTGSHTLVWQPPADAGFGPFDAGAVKVALKAWPTNSPPDYMVVDLVQKDRGARYYASAEAIPGGVTDARYKTDYLVLRRIPAAGVTWRMGSPSTELGSADYRTSEQTHLVELSEDYYCAVYPTTYRQTYWLNGKAFVNSGDKNGNRSLAELNWGWDWPQVDIQYCSYRSWFHKSTCTYVSGLTDKYSDDTANKFWPKDGHEIDAAGTSKCTACQSGTYTPLLTKFRTNYGFMFDFLTDAQWEFACRGGAANGGHAICDGTDLSDAATDAGMSKYGWCADETYGTHVAATNSITCCLPKAVGGKLPNGYGLYDMHGLVWEQTLDFCTTLGNSSTVAVDPVGAKWSNVGGNRTVRGGAFCTEAKHLRCARRKEAGGSSLYFDKPDAKTADADGLYKRSKGYRFWLPCAAVR
jgi:formylglycine-generating enzyme required for sulfatase activity